MSRITAKEASAIAGNPRLRAALDAVEKELEKVDDLLANTDFVLEYVIDVELTTRS